MADDDAGDPLCGGWRYRSVGFRPRKKKNLGPPSTNMLTLTAACSKRLLMFTYRNNVRQIQFVRVNRAGHSCMGDSGTQI